MIIKDIRLKIAVILLILILPISAFPIEVYFSPDGGTQDRIIRLINNAKDSVDVMMYGFTSPELAEALVNAHKRGMRVRVILDKSQAAGAHSVSRYLLDKGLNVRIEHQKGIMHNKVGIIDNQFLITGSYNWTKSAEESNQENCLIITNEDDPDIISFYQQRFEYLWRLNAP